MNFNTLYGLPSNGKKIKQWSIQVEKTANGAVIKRFHGYVDCKITESEKEITKGKNIGKKNETTPLQQAINEATSIWKKQIESGYKENIEELQTKTQLLPMLAFDFNKREKDIVYPCYIQPKLDGVRMLVKVTKSGIECISRTGKKFENMQHIENDLKALQLMDVYYDGELFTTEIPFEEISGLCRKQDKINEILKLKFHIFDVFSEDQLQIPFKERYLMLNGLEISISKKKINNIVFVPTSVCKSKEEMLNYHSKYILESYEGVILRNECGDYKPGFRNKHLQKYKEFQDEEFEIVGAESGVGLEQDCAIFICKNKNNKEFSVRPRGTREVRKEYLRNIENLKGKSLTVRYQNLSESGIVRFGVGIAIRDYE